MPRPFYQPGTLCPTCHTPMVMGKDKVIGRDSAYCKPCYVAYKESQKNGTPQYQAPQAPAIRPMDSAMSQEMWAKIQEIEVVIGKIRVAFNDMNERITKFETRLKNVESYQLGENPTASAFHGSFKPDEVESITVDTSVLDKAPWDGWKPIA